MANKATRVLLFLIVVSQLSASPAGQPAASTLVTTDLLLGLSLRPIGPADPGGRVVDIAAVEAAPSTFYAASANGGLWKTTDGGATLSPQFTSEGSHSIGAIALFQPNPDILWLGTGEASNRRDSTWGDGVYKSTDGGATWDHVGLRDTRHIGRIALHPTNPDIAFVAALGHLWGPNKERGLFRTVDGGKTWANVLFIDNDTGVSDVAIDPANPKVLYAAAYQRRRRAWGFHGGGPASALHKSIDGGETWSKLTQGLPQGTVGRIGVAIHRANPRIVYATFEQGLRYDARSRYAEPQGGVYRSEDHGETWTRQSNWNPHPREASRIEVDPADDQRVYVAGASSYSDDGGRSFKGLDSQAAEGRVVWIDPRTPSRLIAGDDAGVSLSDDRGATWRRVRVPASQVRRISVDTRDPYWIYAGVMDQGSWAGPHAAGTESQWLRTNDGDGFANVIDPADNRTLFTSTAFLGLSRFDLQTRERTDVRPGGKPAVPLGTRDWKTWQRPEPKPDEPAPPRRDTSGWANADAPVLLSPHEPRILYAGTTELWRSEDRGATWVPLRNRTTGVDRSTLRLMTQLPSESTPSLDDGTPYYPTISAVAESPRQRGVLYLGTDDGTLHVSRDKGRTWLNIANRLPNLPKTSYVSSIEASRHADLTVYVSFDNHRSADNNNYLYRSTDGGSTWTAIDGDLPSRRVIRVVREDPRNPAVLYLGTAEGCYVSFDRGSHWVDLGMNLPRVGVNDLLVHPRDNDLVIATDGRGVWVLDDAAALQGLTPAVLSSDAHLFPAAPVPAAAADVAIDFYLKNGGPAAVTIHASDGRLVATLAPSTRRGLNRVRWPIQEAGALVPGSYEARLEAGGRSYRQTFEVKAAAGGPADPEGGM